MSKCPNKIKSSCNDCGAQCYCDMWKGYQQGREDGHKDISWKVADLNIQLKNAELRGYHKGKEDVIAEIQKEMASMKSKAYQFFNNDYATGYISAISTLEGFTGQIKEQKNE